MVYTYIEMAYLSRQNVIIHILSSRVRRTLVEHKTHSSVCYNFYVSYMHVKNNF